MRKFYLQMGTLFLIMCWSSGVMAIEFTLGNVQVNSHGYVTVGMLYGVEGDDHHDTIEGFQSSVFNVLTENNFTFNRNLRVFASAMFTGDLAYAILDDDKDWEDRGFDNSKDELEFDDDLRDILQEVYVNWTPGNFAFRVGKQIVAWGEMDVIRIMDQINPLDNSRGITDIEFETSILPIWLGRAEYYLQPSISWLNDVGLEFIFNPNLDFRGNRGPGVGNDVWGIWSANIDAGPGTVVGAFDSEIKEPDEWDSQFAFRVKAYVGSSLITLNYFYGRELSPVTQITGAPRVTVAGDGIAELHLPNKGYYPRRRTVGVTFTADVPWVSSSFFGGVAPTFRLEGLYGFDSSFGTASNQIVEHDELYLGIAMDWKIKIPFLNERAYFGITSQLTNRRILDYPDQDPLAGWREDNFTSVLVLSTTYFHNKLMPVFVWARDITNESDLLKYQLTYDHNSTWAFTVGSAFFTGETAAAAFEVFDNKDHIYANVAWKF
jgi:uncharacterized protein DUF1302